MSTMRSPEPPDMCLPSSLAEDEKDEVVDARGLVPFASPSLLAGRLRFLNAYQRSVMPSRRRKREMTPAEKKDATYWDKRRKNNEAAKRSREKRRLNDLMLEGQLHALSEENTQLRAEVLSLSQYYVGLGWGTTARHPLHPGAALHCPAPPHLQPSVWGLNAGQPPSGCCQDLCQLWPQPGPYSSSPSTSSTQLLSHLRGSQGYGPPLPCALGLDRLEEAPGQADSTAPQQVSSSSDPDGKRQLSPAPSMCPASSSPAGDLDAPSDQNWLLTGLSNPSNQYSKLLVPWSSPCTRPSSPITCWPPALPLPLRDAGRTNLGIGSVWNFSNKFRMLSAEISQMRRYLKPDNAYCSENSLNGFYAK